MSKRALSILILLFTLSACSKKVEAPAAPPPAPGPTAAASMPNAPTTPSPAPIPLNTAYEGTWIGSSGENLEFRFRIEGNQVTYVQANYSGQNGSCHFNGGISNDGPVLFDGKSFTAHGKNDRGPIEFTATGTIKSPLDASGTLVWKGKSDLCGNIDLKYEWTAKKTAEEE